MKTKLCVLILLLVAALAQAQTNNLTALLQSGLFEEQANRNLDAAIADYTSLATQFDKDRQLAATAVFRLGECYRAQGKTNEAAAQYQRILRDFSDEQTLATLSRQNLTGMGMSAPSTTATASAAGLAQQKQLLDEEIKLVEQQLASQQAMFKTGTLPSDGVLTTQQKVLELKRQLAALDSNRPEITDLSIPVTSEEDQEIQRIQRMIQNSPDLINARMDGSTPLGKAAANGWLKVAAYLMDHGADVNSSYALSAAVNAGNRAMVELLLSRGADVSAMDNSYGRTLLQTAVQKGYQSVAEVLLANKADVNAQAVSGDTALDSAASAGQVKIVKILLAAGANPNVENKNGRTPLSFAAERGPPEMMKLLLDAKADPNGGKLDAPLLCAIYRHDAASAELLLQAGGNPNAAGRIDWQRQPVFPVGSGRSVSPAGGFGNSPRSVTPLWLAISENQFPMVQLLLKFKADPNDSRTDGQPLLFSTLSDTNILEVLLDAGAKVDAMGVSANVRVGNTWIHLTPLGEAARLNNAAAVEILLKHGANPNVRDPIGGYTPLHWAANFLADRKVFELLLAYKAERNVRDDSGQTPLDILKQKTKADDLTTDSSGKVLAGELADLLRQHGALDKLPDWDRITVSRPSANYSQAVFQKGANDWNQFSLLELIGEMELIGKMGEGNIGGNLIFADLARLVVVRPNTNGTTARRIEVNLLDATNGVDCTKDIPLEFGDVVEISEREHTLAEPGKYLSKEQLMAIFNYLRNKAGEAKLIVAGGQTIQLPLQPFYSEIYEVIPGNAAQHVLTSSSDLSRVKVIRRDAKTGKNHEWILDSSGNQSRTGQINVVGVPISGGVPITTQISNGSSLQSSPDLWLRDGDVIEVPEKP